MQKQHNQALNNQVSLFLFHLCMFNSPFLPMQWIPRTRLFIFVSMFTPSQTILFCNKHHRHVHICYEQNMCFLSNGRSCPTFSFEVSQNKNSADKTVRIKGLFFSGKKVFMSDPSYMNVIAHLTNSLNINFHSCSTYSLLSVLSFFHA